MPVGRIKSKAPKALEYEQAFEKTVLGDGVYGHSRAALRLRPAAGAYVLPR